MIEFSDGMKFDTSGDYRVDLRSDGYYVVGNGVLASMNSEGECEKLIAKLNGEAARDAARCYTLHDEYTGEKLDLPVPAPRTSTPNSQWPRMTPPVFPPDPVKLKLARVRFSLDEILATEPDDYLSSEETYQQFQNQIFAAIRRAVDLLNGEGER